MSPPESHLFAPLLRGEFHLQGVRDLREALSPSPPNDSAHRRRAARTTQQLRLLRARGLILSVASDELTITVPRRKANR